MSGSRARTSANSRRSLRSIRRAHDRAETPHQCNHSSVARLLGPWRLPLEGRARVRSAAPPPRGLTLPVARRARMKCLDPAQPLQQRRFVNPHGVDGLRRSKLRRHDVGRTPRPLKTPVAKGVHCRNHEQDCYAARAMRATTSSSPPKTSCSATRSTRHPSPRAPDHAQHRAARARRATRHPPRRRAVPSCRQRLQ